MELTRLLRMLIVIIPVDKTVPLPAVLGWWPRFERSNKKFSKRESDSETYGKQARKKIFSY
jgi:hypothetical protein